MLSARLSTVVLSLTLLVAGFCLAQPVVTMVDGNLLPDGTLAIHGHGFGSKEPAAPYLVDRLTNVEAYLGQDLADGDLVPTQADGCTYCPWWSSSHLGDGVRYSSDSPRLPEGAAYRSSGVDYLILMDLGEPRPDRLLVNWWVRSSQDLAPYGVGKLITIFANNDGADGAVIWSTADLRRMTDPEHDGTPGPMVDSHASAVGQLDDWTNLELRIDSSNQIDLGYGRIEALVNSVVIHDLDCWAREPLNKIKAFGLRVPAADPAMDLEFDWTDIYIDTSFARVLLCDSPSLDSAGYCELQIPQAWEPNLIHIATRLGRFVVGDEVYLFVIDGQGQASSGVLVAIGDDEGPGMPSSPTVYLEE